MTSTSAVIRTDNPAEGRRPSKRTSWIVINKKREVNGNVRNHRRYTYEGTLNASRFYPVDQKLILRFEISFDVLFLSLRVFSCLINLLQMVFNQIDLSKR